MFPNFLQRTSSNKPSKVEVEDKEVEVDVRVEVEFTVLISLPFDKKDSTSGMI